MTENEAFTLINSDYIAHSSGISRWADLGCGEGLFSLALSRLLTGKSIIYAIDKNPLLKPRITNNGVEIIIEKLDFVKDDPGLQNLDGILMANAFHYVKDKLEFIRKIKKSLNSSAVFLIVEYDTDRPVATWVPYPLSFLSLTKLFKSAGYSQIKKLNQRASVYGRADMYSALVIK